MTFEYLYSASVRVPRSMHSGRLPRIPSAHLLSNNQVDSTSTGRGRNRLTDCRLTLHVRHLNERLRNRQIPDDRRDVNFACALSHSLELHVVRRVQESRSAHMIFVYRAVRVFGDRILFAMCGLVGERNAPFLVRPLLSRFEQNSTRANLFVFRIDSLLDESSSRLAMSYLRVHQCSNSLG